MANDIDMKVGRLVPDTPAYDAFVREHETFILKCASHTVHRYVTRGDDEWSIALQAFVQAMARYEPDKGPFRAFAALVIRSRIIDHLRARKALALETQSDQMDAFLAPDDHSDMLRLEIEMLGQTLKAYGFGFLDIADQSPKANKTQRSCAAAVRHLLGDGAQRSRMRASGRLPVSVLHKATGVSKKTLERHRNYIIAAVEILSGDYPGLSEYLHVLKRGE